MILSAVKVLLCVSFITGLGCLGACQTSAQLQTYFKESIGLSQEQIADIRQGKAVAKVLKSRTPAEIFVFGAVFIKAAPDSYIKFASDFDRLRKLPEYLSLGKFSNPPQLSDLEGFNFDQDDIKALRECKPRHCEVQLPAQSMEKIQQAVDWAKPDSQEQVNRILHRGAIEHLQAYQREGNQALGVYHDKDNPTDVPKQFEHMLSYARTLPEYLPKFHRYLLAYPDSKPPEVQDSFYWAKVKFGLKPTLRVVQILTFRGRSANEPVYAVAEKQLYSSHYFETALDLTFCVADPDDTKQAGFYLIKAMGSEQGGLTGFKGSIVRKVAVSRTASSLEKSLTAIKTTLENNQ